MTDRLESMRQFSTRHRGVNGQTEVGETIDWAIAEIELLRVVSETALTTLEQIASTPRNRGAKRNASATAMFLRTQMEQSK